MSLKIPPSTVVISVGMQRAGSAWYYSLTHELWVAMGGQDAHQVREKFHLDKILTAANNNMGKMTARKLIQVIWPSFLGYSFVIKSHQGPTWFLKFLHRLGWVKLTYIYRDPRDAALSAHEFGQRVLREKGRPNGFTKLDTVEKAIDRMVEMSRIWKQWTKVPGVPITRYEDLLTDYDHQVKRLTDYLGLDMNNPVLQDIVEKNRPGRAADGQIKTHFYKGQIGRFRDSFTAEQKQYALLHLGPYLEQMGYPRE